MNCLFRPISALLATLLVAAHVHADGSGWMQIQVTATSRAIPMGPFTLDVAIGGKPVDKVKALILLSHGNAGTELGRQGGFGPHEEALPG